MKIEKLYHYTKLSNAIESILPERKLLINSRKCVNDPVEKDYRFNFMMGDYKFEDKSLKIQQFETDLNDKTKLLCFSTDKIYSRKYLIEGYKSMRMWANYADNHQGVCLEIDKDKFYEENKKKIIKNQFKKVKYINKSVHDIPYIDITKSYNNDEKNRIIKKHLEYLFFEKFKDWESESEFRLVYFDTTGDNKEKYCKIENSLSAIYLGIDFNLNYLPSIEKFVDKRYKIDLYNNEFKINLY